MWSISESIGEGGLPRITAADASNSNCVEIYLFGATVTSWRCDGNEKIFVSPLALFNGVKAVRGGIPVVFPQFGQPLSTMPQHGFARTLNWSVASHKYTDDSALISLRLDSNEHTLSVWPHPFSLNYVVTITSKDLSCSLEITNTGDAPFKCQALLHTYFRVPDSRLLSIYGFNNLNYRDKTRGGETFLDSDKTIHISQEVDRVYVSGGASARIPDITISEHVHGSEMQVSKRAMLCSELQCQDIPSDTVLWNPWIEKSIALADLSDDGYISFVCVEPGVVANWTEVNASEKLILSQTLTPSVNAQVLVAGTEDVFSRPLDLKHKLNIAFADSSVTWGNIVAPAASAVQPTATLSGGDAPSPDDLYTLVCCDPDAVSRSNPLFREFIHWVIVNAPGADFSKGETAAPYVGPGPPHGSGLHRYFFCAFKQSHLLIVEEAAAHFQGRGGLKTEAWVDQQGLVGPVAINMFQSKWDESVDALHSAMGFVPPPMYRSPAQREQHGES
jgi:glucose-6-phosphate 1-epimerase